MERKSAGELLRMMHALGQEIRERSFATIDQSARLTALVELGLLAMLPISKVIDEYQPKSNDERTLQLLLIRLKNAVSAARELALVGLYQVALSVVRDTSETAALLEYLSMDRSRIGRWQKSQKPERERGEFSAGRIRAGLSERSSDLTRRFRAELYGLLSDGASHPTFWSYLLLTADPEGVGVHQGAFFDSEKLDLVIGLSTYSLFSTLEVLGELLPDMSPELKTYVAENDAELTRRTGELIERFGRNNRGTGPT